MNQLDDEIFRELLPRLRRFAYSLTRDLDNADDLVQSCIERAMKAWHQRRPESELRAWLFTILYREFLDGQRKQKRFSQILSIFSGGRDLDQEEEIEAAGPDILLDTHKQLTALSQLSSDQRALLLLVAVEGLSYQEISEQLDVPIGTIMSRVSRARQAFRRLTFGESSSVTIKPVLKVLKNE